MLHSPKAQSRTKITQLKLPQEIFASEKLFSQTPTDRGKFKNYPSDVTCSAFCLFFVKVNRAAKSKQEQIRIITVSTQQLSTYISNFCGAHFGSRNDQLAIIFAVIGTPTESDKSFVTDLKALEYLEQFPPNPRADLKKKYPGSSDVAIDFLEKVLVFNPYYRSPLQTCLEHPLFAQVRNLEKEAIVGQPVELEFEKEELNKKRLRELILAECQYYLDQKKNAAGQQDVEMQKS